MTPEQIAQIDPAYWAVLRKIRLQAGVFSFDQRPYQIEPMQSTVRRKCYRKATQGGITEIERLISLHGMIHGK